jgi:hypothetical protein
MLVQLNNVRKSQIDAPNGVAGLDENGYLNNIGQVGHPPQINPQGAIEAIVAHRSGTLAELQALGALPQDEIVIVKDAGVPVGFRVGDAAETPGGKIILSGMVSRKVTNFELSSASFVQIPELALPLPTNSIIELSGIFRFNTVAGSYSFSLFSQNTVPLWVQDGPNITQVMSGSVLSLTQQGGLISIIPTIIHTGASDLGIIVSYQKLSGSGNKAINHGIVMYRVIE